MPICALWANRWLCTEAEDIGNRLQVRGYALTSLADQDYINRLATARLTAIMRGV